MIKGKTFLVLGSGIAGITCVETLETLVRPEDSILLLSSSNILKRAVNVVQLTRSLEVFDVKETTFKAYKEEQSGPVVGRTKFVQTTVTKLNSLEKKILGKQGEEYGYDVVCLCTGARPKLILENHPNVIGLRDLESVQELCDRLKTARKLTIVGNGGIALELVAKLDFCQIIWVIKDDHIGNTFFDSDASDFFLESLELRDSLKSDPQVQVPNENEAPNKESSIRSEPAVKAHPSETYGASLGPNWTQAFNRISRNGFPENQMDSSKNQSACLKNVDIHFSCEVVEIECSRDDSRPYPIRLRLSDGNIVECDFLISATGVLPNIDFIDDEIQKTSDGSVIVDSLMRTSIEHVYAAGDCCWIDTSLSDSNLWFQMRLWSQARSMGILAAHSMYFQATNLENSKSIAHLDPPIGLAFDIFSHMTHFFGFKVVFLGLYNGQRLIPTEFKSLVRCIPGKEYIKLIMKEGRLQGALLIGDTDLEETFENLILSQFDLADYGDQLLDPSIDIEDYFD